MLMSVMRRKIGRGAPGVTPRWAGIALPIISIVIPESAQRLSGTQGQAQRLCRLKAGMTGLVYAKRLTIAPTHGPIRHRG